jgi:hypothetical protein
MLYTPRLILVPTAAAAPFALNQRQLDTLGIATRELEILTLIARM